MNKNKFSRLPEQFIGRILALALATSFPAQALLMSASYAKSKKSSATQQQIKDDQEDMRTAKKQIARDQQEIRDLSSTDYTSDDPAYAGTCSCSSYCDSNDFAKSGISGQSEATQMTADGCYQIYQRNPSIFSLSNCCQQALNNCGMIVRQRKVTALKKEIKDLGDQIAADKEDIKSLQDEENDGDNGDCPDCDLAQAMKPSTGQLALGWGALGVQALGMGLNTWLGIRGMNQYYGAVNNQLAACTAVGIPCQTSVMPYMAGNVFGGGLGGFGYGLGGMGYGLGSGLGYGMGTGFGLQAGIGLGGMGYMGGLGYMGGMGYPGGMGYMGGLGYGGGIGLGVGLGSGLGYMGGMGYPGGMGYMGGIGYGYPGMGLGAGIGFGVGLGSGMGYPGGMGYGYPGIGLGYGGGIGYPGMGGYGYPGMGGIGYPGMGGYGYPGMGGIGYPGMGGYGYPGMGGSGMPYATAPIYGYNPGNYGANGSLTSGWGVPATPWGTSFTSPLNPYSGMYGYNPYGSYNPYASSFLPAGMNPQFGAMYGSSAYGAMGMYGAASQQTNLMMAQQEMYEAQARYNQSLSGSYGGYGYNSGSYNPYGFTNGIYNYGTTTGTTTGRTF